MLGHKITIMPEASNFANIKQAPLPGYFKLNSC